MVHLSIKQKVGYCLMHRPIKRAIAVIVIISAMLSWFWPYITMNFAGRAHYTEIEKRKYEFYTPELLKRMPRISSRYDFDYVNVTGPASHIYSIRFYDINDSSRVDEYLKSARYLKQKRCHVEAACWQRKNSEEIVTVSHLTGSNAILVSVISNF
jgi:hypothetical protein